MALERWPVDGVPRNAGAWLTTTARRKAVDRLRRQQTLARKQALLLREMEQAAALQEAAQMEAIPDERLKLIFTCCHPALATTGEGLLRPELYAETIRLGSVLLGLLDQEGALQADVGGLLALMLLHNARRPARSDAVGDLATLEERDRSLWNRAQIDEGLAILERAMGMGRPGPYQIQAAIGALHAEARRVEETDWKQIALLYGELGHYNGSPVVALNHAVAVAMAGGPMQGLAMLERLGRDARLEGYHLYHAARADLLRRAGWREEALAAYEAALALVTNEGERRYLQRRVRELSGPEDLLRCTEIHGVARGDAQRILASWRAGV